MTGSAKTIAFLPIWPITQKETTFAAPGTWDILMKTRLLILKPALQPANATQVAVPQVEPALVRVRPAQVARHRYLLGIFTTTTRPT